ncbi:SAM-dependent methyltransferase, partial [bacterium M00.F.Ca.ET.230.01.1.1]
MTPFDNLSELPVQNTRVSGRMGLGTWLITRLLNNIHRGRLRITLPGGGTI